LASVARWPCVMLQPRKARRAPPKGARLSYQFGSGERGAPFSTAGARMVEREGTEAKLGFKGVPAHAAARTLGGIDRAGRPRFTSDRIRMIASEPKIHPEGGGRRAS
jgi:hypothetical protein